MTAKCITVLVIIVVVGIVAPLECRPTVRVGLFAAILMACNVPGTEGTGPTVVCMMTGRLPDTLFLTLFVWPSRCVTWLLLFIITLLRVREFGCTVLRKLLLTLMFPTVRTFTIVSVRVVLR